MPQKKTRKNSRRLAAVDTPFHRHEVRDRADAASTAFEAILTPLDLFDLDPILKGLLEKVGDAHAEFYQAVSSRCDELDEASEKDKKTE